MPVSWDVAIDDCRALSFDVNWMVIRVLGESLMALLCVLFVCCIRTFRCIYLARHLRGACGRLNFVLCRRLRLAVSNLRNLIVGWISRALFRRLDNIDVRMGKRLVCSSVRLVLDL